MNYSIEFDKNAFKYLRKLDKPTRTRIVRTLEILSENPFNSELDIKRMQGTIDEFRLRIGIYRIVYSLENDKLIIYVIKVGSRGDVYKS
jgi:mRNA interferase RelE/StbE